MGEHAEPEESESELEHRSSRLRSLDGVWLELGISETRWDNQQGIVSFMSPVEAFATVIKLLLGKKCT